MNVKFSLKKEIETNKENIFRQFTVKKIFFLSIYNILHICPSNIAASPYTTLVSRVITH